MAVTDQRWKRLVPGLALGGVMVGALLWLWRLPPRSQTLASPLEGQGVHLRRVEASELGQLAGRATSGDWLLESDRVRLLMGAEGPGAERAIRHGRLLALTSQDFSRDHLTVLLPILRQGEQDVRLDIVGVSAARVDAKPCLRLTQRAPELGLELNTDLSLSAGEPRVELVTRIRNQGGKHLEGLRPGDVVGWPGAPSYASGIGSIQGNVRDWVPWFGAASRELSYALVFPGGAVEATFSLDVLGSISQFAFASPIALKGGDSYVYRRSLFVLPSGLASVAELAFAALGKDVRRVVGKLTPTPQWGSVEAISSEQRSVVKVATDAQGRFELGLPAGNYTLRARTPGGSQSQAIELPLGVTTPLTLELTPPPPAVLRYSVSDAQARPLPARGIIHGIAPTQTPLLEQSEHAVLERNYFYSINGAGDVELPAGHYRVSVTRGPEYELATAEIELGAGETKVVPFRLDRSVDTRAWLACDFHVHAAPSPDSGVSLHDRVVTLLAEGVEFAAATDHNHVTDYGPSVAEVHGHAHLGAAVGVEVTTNAWGHFNAFPYPPGAALPPFDVPPPEIFKSLRSLAPEAVIQVNHPRMGGIGYFKGLTLDPAGGLVAAQDFSFDFDAVEVVNGYELTWTEVLQRNLQDWFALINSGHHITAVGNSDSHRLTTHWVGYPRTYVRVAQDAPSQVSAAEVADALRRGRAIVSSGPFVTLTVNASAGPGDTLSVQPGRVALSVLVQAPEWIDVRSAELYVNGELRLRAPEMLPVVPGQALRLQWNPELELTRDAALVVIVRGLNPPSRALPDSAFQPFALTNPVFVDVDGDGRVGALSRAAP